MHYFYFKEQGRQMFLLCQFLTDKIINRFLVLEYKTASECHLRNKKKANKGISIIEKMILKNCPYTKKSKTVSEITDSEGNFVKVYKMRFVRRKRDNGSQAPSHIRS